MSGFTKQEQAEFDAAMDAVAKYEQEIADHNAKVLEDNNIPYEDFESLIDYCDVRGKIEIVDKPLGSDNDEDPNGVFKRVFVKQWSVGTEGDSFEGIIYGELAPNKWLQVPFSC